MHFRPPTPETPDRRLAEAFRRNPAGPHEPALTALLLRMRGAPAAGKHVLVCLEPHRRWSLGRLSGTRGGGVAVTGPEFTDRAAAEWHVFRLRWQALFGEAPR